MASKLDVVKSIIGSVAPALARALAGPLAGLAVAKISQAVTGKPDTPPDQVAAAIQQSTDPDIRVKLKQADAEFAETMKQLDVDLDALAEKDRESARGMQVATRSWIPAFLAIALTVGFFGLLALLALHQVPAANETVIVQDTGILGTAWVGMIAYYFGSSTGSDRKTEIMANQVAGRRNVTGGPSSVP